MKALSWEQSDTSLWKGDKSKSWQDIFLSDVMMLVVGKRAAFMTFDVTGRVVLRLFSKFFGIQWFLDWEKTWNTNQAFLWLFRIKFPHRQIRLT